MTSVRSLGTMPARPGTVYLGKYSFSRETLDETRESQELVDFKDPPKSARSLRSTLKNVWVKSIEPQKSSPPVTRHHRFRRWLNKRERDFTCSWSETDERTEPSFDRLLDPAEFDSFQNEHTGIVTNESPIPCTRGSEDDKSGLEMFSRIYLDSDSGATLSNGDPRPAVTLPSTCRKRFDLLRSFRLRLHRSRERDQLTLTDRYLGSEENIERCLHEMDLMPFDLTAPSSADNIHKDLANPDRIQLLSGPLSDRSTMVEEMHRPATLRIKRNR
ncbi:LAFA_0F21792g1_1 [Lachancea sp. 'fantastica']|nr:LAFA_0F21792g1_1 [Lachancea sp. 'fantastica']